MNEQKIAPVLSDNDICALTRPYPKTLGIVGVCRAIEQAVLARVGAVRDQALQDAIEAIGTVTWSVGNSVAGELASEWTGRSMSEARDAIRALKGTPAAAVPDAQPVAWGTLARGRLFAHCGTESEIDSYIQQVHQSRDDVTLCKVAMFIAPQPSGNPGPLAAVELDAERYRMVRRGQHWSVIDGIGDDLRGDALDAAADAAIAASKGRAMDKQQAKSAMNESLCDFASRWKMDGDYLRCVKCKRPMIASRTDLDFSHAAGCKNAATSEPRPWLALVDILRPIVAQPTESNGASHG